MKDFFRNNGFLILIAALLLAAVTAVGSYVLQGVPNPLENILGVVTTPVRNGISALAGWAEGIYNYSFHYDELQAENERLRSELARLQESARDAEAAVKENERLRELLGLREQRRDLTFESARIVERDYSNWSSMITVNKGTSHGVAVGDCAITEAGYLVGVVTEAGLNWSTVRTVIDSETSIGALVFRSGANALAQGDFSLMSQGRLRLEYLGADPDVMTGDLVVTAGLGDYYPSQLVIGYVEEVAASDDGLSQYAVIRPEADLAELEQVFIITDFTIVD